MTTKTDGADTTHTPPRSAGTSLMIRLSDAYRRLLALILAIIGPSAAYALMSAPARFLYRLADPLRQRCEAQCRAALGNRYAERGRGGAVRRIAEQAFVHRVWNLTDLLLAPRYLRANNFGRYGGEFPEPYRSWLQEAQRQRRAVILLTAYYGPYDLLPLFLGYNGIRAAAVYRRHGNAAYDSYRQAVRSGSGCEMIPVEEAVERLPRELENGGTVALLSDHHAERRGIAVNFLGLPTAASPAVGLLAQRYDAIVAVAGIRRLGARFRFEVCVSDYFDAAAWRDADDPVAFITARYVAGLERLVLGDPSQYLWVYARWGSLFADQLSAAPRASNIEG